MWGNTHRSWWLGHGLISLGAILLLMTLDYARLFHFYSCSPSLVSLHHVKTQDKNFRLHDIPWPFASWIDSSVLLALPGVPPFKYSHRACNASVHLVWVSSPLLTLTWSSLSIGLCLAQHSISVSSTGPGVYQDLVILVKWAKDCFLHGICLNNVLGCRNPLPLSPKNLT